MSIDTTLKSHWILDGEYTDHNSSVLCEKQILVDTINSSLADPFRRSISTTEIKKRLTDVSTEKYDKINFDFPVLDTKRKPSYKDYIKESQNWIGYITELSPNRFTAKLIDKKDPSTYEVAQFDVKEVSAGDAELIKVGALFYWSVGYANQRGQISKYSLIRFKRGIDFSLDDIDSITDKANEMSENIIWD